MDVSRQVICTGPTYLHTGINVLAQGGCAGIIILVKKPHTNCNSFIMLCMDQLETQMYHLEKVLSIKVSGAQPFWPMGWMNSAQAGSG